MNRRTETENRENFAALICAAGLSSRMGDWKAAMKIEGVPNILREIRTCLSAGISRVLVVTGYRREELESLVKSGLSKEDRGKIRFVYNPDYAGTQMFESVCLGLRAFREEKGFAGVLFFPVDVPLFSVYTLRDLQLHAGKKKEEVFLPVCKGRTGHPILIRTQAVEKILEYRGEKGLKGAIALLRQGSVSVPDPGILLDADTPEEFRALEEEAQERRFPGERRCMELLAFFGAHDRLTAHGRAVADLAEELAEADGSFSPEEIRVLRAAGYLHDLVKGQPRHAEAGAEILESLGYPQTAQLVRTHMDLPGNCLKKGNAQAVLFLADKLVQGDRRVSLEERFAPTGEKFRNDPEALAGRNRRFETAKKAEEIFCTERSMGCGKTGAVVE